MRRGGATKICWLSVCGLLQQAEKQIMQPSAWQYVEGGRVVNISKIRFHIERTSLLPLEELNVLGKYLYLSFMFLPTCNED